MIEIKKDDLSIVVVIYKKPSDHKVRAIAVPVDAKKVLLERKDNGIPIVIFETEKGSGEINFALYVFVFKLSIPQKMFVFAPSRDRFGWEDALPCQEVEAILFLRKTEIEYPSEVFRPHANAKKIHRKPSSS